MSPCLPGVPHSLLSTPAAQGRCSHPAPAHPSATRREQTPSPGKSHSPDTPSSSTPQPHGHPKRSPQPGQAPRSPPAVTESCHPVPSHLLLPNFFFVLFCFVRKQLTLFFEEQQMSETLPAPFMMLNLLPGSTIAILMTNAPTALTRLSAGIENRSRGGHAVSGLLEENGFQPFS